MARTKIAPIKLNVTVDEATRTKLARLMRMWRTSRSEVIRRLVREAA